LNEYAIMLTTCERTGASKLQIEEIKAKMKAADY
jgi:hypothetical protein